MSATTGDGSNSAGSPFPRAGWTCRAARKMWPDAVTVDGKPAAVIGRGGRPMIELEPGEHQITGRFFWRTIPEMIHIPPSLGLLALTVNARPITAPLLDERGRLWLQKSDSTAGREDRLQVKIFRLIKDTIPLQVHTVLRLEVSGKSRELTLDKILLTNAVPMAVTSDLPARIDTAGTLQVQARAGQWEVYLQSRLPGPVHALNLEATPHGDQIWSFEAHHDLRMVEIKGPSPVEPGQTEMPQQWRGLHAYLMKPGTTMTFHEIRRGDAQPAPDQLNLNRKLVARFRRQRLHRAGQHQRRIDPPVAPGHEPAHGAGPRLRGRTGPGDHPTGR